MPTTYRILTMETLEHADVSNYAHINQKELIALGQMRRKNDLAIIVTLPEHLTITII
jgi:hypothetical protein